MSMCLDVTEAIVHDCLEGFIYSYANVLGLMYIDNEWSVLALTAHHGSLIILDYLFSENCIVPPDCLRCPAHKSELRPTLFEIIADRHDIKFLSRLLDLIGPRTDEVCQELKRNMKLIEREERYKFCKFITPRIAHTFERFGCPLYDVSYCTPTIHYDIPWGANAYHAAVSNGTEFLDYLYEESNLCLTDTDSNDDSPLHYAVRQNRLDTVTWLVQNGGDELALSPTQQTPAAIAACMTSEESVMILGTVLSSFTHGCSNSTVCASLVLAVVNGLVSTITSECLDDNLPSARKDHEQRAIKKCKLIFFFLVPEKPPIYDGLEWKMHPDDKQAFLHKCHMASVWASQHRFEDLARLLEREPEENCPWPVGDPAQTALGESLKFDSEISLF